MLAGRFIFASSSAARIVVCAFAVSALICGDAELRIPFASQRQPQAAFDSSSASISSEQHHGQGASRPLCNESRYGGLRRESWLLPLY